MVGISLAFLCEQRAQENEDHIRGNLQRETVLQSYRGRPVASIGDVLPDAKH
jgi:hypothetical protein